MRLLTGRYHNMNENEKTTICQAAESGEEKFLEHLETHHAGKLVRWDEKEAEVDIYGKHETWPWEKCKEFRPDANYMES
jgi:hypothetical protein